MGQKLNSYYGQKGLLDLTRGAYYFSHCIRGQRFGDFLLKVIPVLEGTM